VDHIISTKEMGRERIDLGDGYLATKFGDLFREPFNILWKNERSQRAHVA